MDTIINIYLIACFVIAIGAYAIYKAITKGNTINVINTKSIITNKKPKNP